MYKRREIKYVAMVLLTVMPLSLWAQVEKQVDEEYDKGYAQGHADGEKVDQRDWGLYGIGGGCLGCFLGGAAVWQAAARSGDTPEHVPEGTSEFKKGYTVGYWDATNSQKKQNALVGGVIGTVLAVAIIAIVVSDIDIGPIEYH